MVNAPELMNPCPVAALIAAAALASPPSAARALVWALLKLGAALRTLTNVGSVTALP